MDSVDVLVMGRKTFEQVVSFGQWPYGMTPVIVLSRGQVEIPPELSETVSQSSGSPVELLGGLSDKGVGHVYVDGGSTIGGFLDAGLIDRITITTVPIALGEGIGLLASVGKDIKLTHEQTKVFDFGFVQTTYSVVHP